MRVLGTGVSGQGSDWDVGHEVNVEATVQRMGGRQAWNGRIAWPGDWMRVSLPLTGAALVAAALYFAPGSARAATYKWVDDQGVVHYTDRVPPEAVD
jgi:hypothetical protein